MTEVIGVRFKSVGKIYHFSPAGKKVNAGDYVIVETARGVECGEVALGVKSIEDSEVVAPLKSIIRIATAQDLKTVEKNKEKEKEAFKICEEKILKHGLSMNLVDVECTFDNNKLLFYFTAENRVDFRELVKDLASVFHTRIELRQIGVRDEAKMLGGLGPCGRPLCCGTFLGDFQPVSIKMAKEQNLSLNPTKISGVCGRLMCCLKYEQDHYEATRKRMPKIGKEVETPEGFGTVMDLNILKETVTVRIFKGDSSELKTFPVDDLKWIRPAPPAEKTTEGKPARRRSDRPALSSTPMEQAEPVAEAIEQEPEEAMEPVHQDNDWLRAVEEALSAAQKKM